MADEDWDDESAAQLIDSVRRNDLSAASALAASRKPLYSFELKELRFWPLHEAAANGHAGLVSLFLARAFDLEAVDFDGFTPLHRAAEAGQLETARLLVGAGARVDLVTALGGGYRLTPLMLAAQRGDVEMVKYLLGAGARADGDVEALPSAVDLDDGPLTKEEQEEALETLEESSRDQRTPLDAATSSVTDAAVLESLVALLRPKAQGAAKPPARKSQPGGRAKRGRETAFHRAVSDNDSSATFKTLAKRGVPLDALDETGQSALHLAALNPAGRFVEVLAELGADVNIRDGEGMTPLHVAASRAHLRPSRALIQAGAQVNAQDSVGRTPLHFAARAGPWDIVRLLLSFGADGSIKDAKGQTPADLVTDDEVRTLLRDFQFTLK